jgi:hypothetical protein
VPSVPMPGTSICCRGARAPTPSRMSPMTHPGAAKALAACAVVLCQIATAACAADIQFDEPLEGRTRACAGSACAQSLTTSVSGFVSGSISSLDLLAGLPPELLPFASLLDLQNYQTSQSLNMDLVDGLGMVVNTLDVAFSVAQLQYSASFLFRSDASGSLQNGPGVDVLATSGYQDVTPFLQAQVDLSGLPYPFGSLAAVFQPEFFPISVAMRTGPLDVTEPPGVVPEPPTSLLLLVGFLSWSFAVTRGRSGLPHWTHCAFNLPRS